MPPPPPKSHKKREPDPVPAPVQQINLWTEEIVGGFCAAVYQTTAMLTGHDWWHRTPEQCRPISQPLCQWAASLPTEVAQKLTENAAPLAVLAGVATVSMPAIALEVDAWRIKRNPQSYGLNPNPAGGVPPSHDSPGDAGVGGIPAAGVSANGKAPPGAGQPTGGIRLPTRPSGFPPRGS